MTGTKEYEQLKNRLARGWNTWNTLNVLSHVLLPEAFALNIGIKEYADGAYLKEALVGRQGAKDEQIHPGPHAYDGSYSKLTLRWRGLEVEIESATDADDLVLLATPVIGQKLPALLVVESGILWNRPGSIQHCKKSGIDSPAFSGLLDKRTIHVYGTAPHTPEPYIHAQTPYLAMKLSVPVGASTGKSRSVEEIRAIIDGRKAGYEKHADSFGELSAVYRAMQTCLAWDTVYEPAHDRVVSPVSRIWNINWGGYVLFCWDTYFAGYIAAIDNKDLAYANAIEITREKTEAGFVPNFGTVNNVASRDRSQPPVGSLVIRELYRKFADRWLLEETFDDLLVWNRWWNDNRVHSGLLCWGSDPFDPVTGGRFEIANTHDRQGAAYESGLDNSPMYDDIPFDRDTHVMQLADAGLMGLYIMDCDALADIARILGRGEEAAELTERGSLYCRNMQRLWDEDTGIFLNRRTDTGEFSCRLSPTNFYPLLGRAASDAQADRMINDHFYNPAEFWGDWIMPSIARNDPAYPDQEYWRGRIWAPMNFLVYLGLRRYDVPKARADLARKSKELLLKEWLANGHVHENYNGDTGEGCDIETSDRFYHWGGLLGLISFIEAGILPAPEEGLVD